MMRDLAYGFHAVLGTLALVAALAALSPPLVRDLAAGIALAVALLTWRVLSVIVLGGIAASLVIAIVDRDPWLAGLFLSVVVCGSVTGFSFVVPLILLAAVTGALCVRWFGYVRLARVTHAAPTFWTRGKVASGSIVLSYFAVSFEPVSGFHVALTGAVPLLCIWVPEILGSHKGWGPITIRSPGGAVYTLGWILLVFPLVHMGILVWN